MPFLSIDTSLFIIFLVLNLVIGLTAGRKVKTLRDFSIGDKNFSTATITSTIVATWVGGGFMFYNLQNIYTDGLKFIIIGLGGPLCLLLIGQVLAVRMGEFLNNISVAEAMGDMYGKLIRVITAVSGILRGMGSVAIQFQVISKMLNLLYDIDGTNATLIAAAIVITYSAFGGIKSVTITDVFQLITFSIFIPILGLIIWNNFRSNEVIHTLKNNPIFSLGNIKWSNTISLLLFFMIPGMHPVTLQRISMARNLEQVKKSNNYSAIIVLLMIISLAWIAILLLSIDNSINPNKLVNFLINNYSYPGLKGLIAVGITAMAMSTADSHLNASAVLATHDILKPLKITWSDSMIVTRFFSVIIGIFSIILAFYVKNLLSLILLGASFYMPIVTTPLLLSIFGFRSTGRSVLVGMVGGLITILFWDHLFGYSGINNVLPGMVANLLFLVGFHYIFKQEGGWVGIKDKQPLLIARQKRRDAYIRFIDSLKNFKVFDYLKNNLPSYEVVYSFFAIYIIGSTYVCFYTIPEEVIKSYPLLYNFITHSVLIVATIFLTYPAWPARFKDKKFIAFFWPVGISYILFIVGTLLVLMSGFDQTQVVIFMVNLLLTSLLFPWSLVLVITSIGILVGYAIFDVNSSAIYFSDITGIGKFKVIYAILIGSSFLISLFRVKQNQNKLEDKNNYLLGKYEDKASELGQIMAYREELLKELKGEDIVLLDHAAAAYMQQAIYRITDYLKLEVTQINLHDLTRGIKNMLKLQDLELSPAILVKQNTKYEFIQADKKKIEQMLINSIICLQKHNESNKPITILIEDAKLGHSLDYMKDYTRQLAAVIFVITITEELPQEKEVYRLDAASSITRTKVDGCKDLLIENARIVDAHYGYGELEKLDMHMYVLPVNVREVRGKVMEILRDPVEANVEEVNHPIAVSVEKDFLDKTKSLSIDKKSIHKALDTIKKYHGGVKRKSGEPFFTHPMQVALILLTYCQDQGAIIAALLHDTVEDTSLSLIQIKSMFGKDVAYIVEKVTNLEDKLRRISSQEHENVYRLMDYGDARAAYVKLADRMHNMRTISGHSKLEKRKHIATETLYFFVPLAEKLSLITIAEELKKLSIEVLGKE